MFGYNKKFSVEQVIKINAQNLLLVSLVARKFFVMNFCLNHDLSTSSLPSLIQEKKVEKLFPQRLVLIIQTPQVTKSIKTLFYLSLNIKRNLYKSITIN